MFSAALKDIVIIVRSQHNGYHVKKAKTMRDDLTQQAEAMGEKVWQVECWPVDPGGKYFL